MKQKKTKFLSILLAVFVTMNSFGMPVHAESDDAQWDLVSIGTVDDTTESTDGEDIIGEDIIGDISEEPPLFPGLPEEYELSEKQLTLKALMFEHIDSLPGYNAPDDGVLYAPGELVYLTESEEDAQIVAEAFGGTLDSYACGVAVIRLSDDRTVAQACLASARADVKLPAVSPNYYKELYATYNDPALSEANTEYQWQHTFVGSSYAWDYGYKGQGVKVGIIDSGILNSHEEFSKIEKHLSMPNDMTSSPTNATTDIDGHGTHVSGIVAAGLNNGKGGAGIAPEATLYVYSVMNADGSITAATEIRGLIQAAEDKVDVINMSLGSGTYDLLEDTVVQMVYDAGIAIFASAGNDSTNGKSYPASYDNVCSIASLQEDGKKSPFSNYNDSVDLAFPGSNIYSTYKTNSSSYTYMSGTSMAAPVATGVAAVILSGAGDVPELAGKTGTDRVDALYKIMSKNAKKCSSAGTGAGTTWLPSVFNIPVDSATAVPSAPTFSLKNNTTINDTSTLLTISSAAGTRIYYNTNGKTPSFKNGVPVNGSLYTSSIYISGAKKKTVKAIAVNPITGKASKVATATYNFAPNPSYVAVTSANGVNKLAPGTSLALKATVRPTYAVSTKVKWSVTPPEGGSGVTVSTSGKVSVARTATAGKYTITATAVDKSGNPYTAATGNYYITVPDASALVKSITLATKSAALSVGSAEKGTLDLAKDITVTYGNGDSDQTAKDIIWISSNTGVATVSSSGVVTAVGLGKADIKAIANDGSNKSASCKITVTQPATSLYISGYSKLAAGKSITLKATIRPTKVSSNKLQWTASGTGVTVKNGKVTASKTASGTYTITATTQDGSNISATHTITVVSGPINKITLPKTMSLFVASDKYTATNSKYLGAEITGGDSTAVTYTSSAPGIASVNATTGLVTARSVGKAKITCTATDGSNKKAVCTVTVGVPVSRLDIVPAEENEGVLAVGCSLKLKAQVGTSYGTPLSTKVNWSVPEQFSDMISVSNSGVVKAKAFDNYKSTDGYSIPNVYVEATAADGSGASARYTFMLVRKVKNFILLCDDGMFIPLVVLDNDYVVQLPYNTTISGPKNNNVGFQNTIYSYYDEETETINKIPAFMPTLEKPTTKTSSQEDYKLSAQDGVKVTVKVKLQTGNKSASGSIILIKTSDHIQYYVKEKK